MRIIRGLDAETDPTAHFCRACREGPFKHDNFRQAVKRDFGDDADFKDFVADDDFDPAEEYNSEPDLVEGEEDAEWEDDGNDEVDPDDSSESEEDEDEEHDEEDDWVDPADPEGVWSEGDKGMEDVRPKYQYTYVRTWGEIEDSVMKEGCRWCRIVIQARNRLPDENFPRGGPSESVSVRLEIRTHTPVDWMKVTNSLDLYLNDIKAGIYYIYAEPENVASEEIGSGEHFRYAPPYVDYEEANQCIENCSQNHDTCPKAEDTILPTRLIDCSDPSSPRLFETHRKIKGRYTTLSYAWGGDQKEKTTKAKLRSYVEEGLPKELPLTIADAITATHRLGLRWLWIDALCIIQDSDEDKLRELADMGHIYQDSYVTLSILSSYRADQGFLPDAADHPVLPFYTKDGKIGEMKLHFYIERRTPGRLARYETVRTHDPLRHRGWCFQETILSPRRIVFSPPGLLYACRGYEQDITRPEEGGQSKPAERIPVTALFSDQKRGKASRGDEELHDLWSHLINRYTACEISYSSDKLVAFSSVAEVYQNITNDEYLAGLWKHRFIDGLLWKCGAMRDRPKEYRAPTWSWASIDGGVEMHTPHMLEGPSTDYEASILSCSVTPANSSHPLGQVKFAILKLQAKVYPLMPNGRKCRFTEEMPTVTDYGSHKLSIGGGWLPPKGSSLRNLDGEAFFMRFDSKEGSEDIDHDFHIIALRAGKKWGGQPQPGFMMGLLVLKVDGQHETYKRVASVDLQHFPEWMDKISLKIVTVV
ncbi:HET-domain-containing protein [Agrocybe pediades]|nr:HET-domain-containing protein [Agrocybe pediades]